MAAASNSNASVSQMLPEPSPSLRRCCGRRYRILLALSGSVAALKAPVLFEELSRIGEVKVICTESSKHFFDFKSFQAAVHGGEDGSTIATAAAAAGDDGSLVVEDGDYNSSLRRLSCSCDGANNDWTALRYQSLFRDQDEWRLWGKKGDPVLHIQLRQWADVMVIAPLDANTLAKLAHGLCDNLLTCVARAWDFRRPLLVAPAMNDLMWAHPFTGRQLDLLQTELGVAVVAPIRKLLACNVEGMGAMASPASIAVAVEQALAVQRTGVADSVAEQPDL